MPVDQNHVAFLGALMGCQRSLYAYIFKLLPRTDEAKDILQKTNLLLLEKAEEFIQVRDFGAWAARHAYFQVLAHRKACQRDRLLFDDTLVAQLAEETRGDLSENDTALRALSECLDRLPASDRRLVEERYRDDKKVHMLAGVLKRTAASVANSLYRIRQALAECIRRRLQAEGGTS